MNQTGSVAAGHVPRYLGIAVLALACMASAASVRGEQQGAVRRLPPVSQLSPATLAPVAVEQPAPPPRVVIHPERAAHAQDEAVTPVSHQVEQPVPSESLVSFAATDTARFPTVAVANNQAQQPRELVPPRVPDPLPESAGETAPPEEERPAAQPPSTAAATEPQTLGRAPTNYSLQFLREQDVLLNPGDWQFDTGFAYTLFDIGFPATVTDPFGDVVDVVPARIRDRQVYTPLAFRYGWTDNIQLFGALPVGWSGTQISTIGATTEDNVGGIGDLTAGIQMHLLAGEDLLPDVVGTLAFTAPTGEFNAPVGSIVPGLALGQGFWAISGQLLFINRYDPVIAFYGVGYRHLFERQFNGVTISPGEQLNYQFGVGFAANDRVTLSAAFTGFYITNTLADNSAIMGTNIEPMSLRFAATVARNDRIVEPFVVVGMTDFAPRASFGVTITFY